MTRRFDGKELLVATHNAGKLAEIQHLFKPFGIEVKSAKDYSLPEPDETEITFVGNARIKAHAAAKATGLVALADDSGIEVEALDGAPGVYTADWAETPTGRDFGLAMARTWDAVQATERASPHKARFCCTLVLAWPDGHDEVFEGVADGTLVWPARGADGHGYDPMFKPDGHELTFAEMGEVSKNEISHRADAFRKLISSCFT